MQSTYIGDIKAWLNDLDSLEKEQKCAAPTFFKPFHFATLALHLSRLGRGIRMPEHLAGYASRMQLWDVLGLQPPVETSRLPTADTFMPLAKLHNRDDAIDSASQLAKIATKYGCDKETENSLSVSLSEIMENCFAHAEVSAPLAGLACAQSWPRGHKAQIAIADIGVGVRSSLQANTLLQERLEATNSCELASEFGVTSKPEKGHAGYGLALARQLLERNGGSFLLVSHSEWFCTSGRHSTAGLLSTPWTGTLVVIEWNLNVPLRVKDVYDSWPLPEGFNDDDFDF